MNNLSFQDKKVAILGVGTEGLAVADFLLDQAEITLLDQLSEEKIIERLHGEELDLFRKLIGVTRIKKTFGPDYLNNLNSFDVVVRSPGISYLNSSIQEALKKGVQITSQIKLFFELCPCPIIGVSGTKGKGTTSSLIFEILKKNAEEGASGQNVYFAGNIGYPAISLISKIKKDDVVILELSSFQLMDLEKSPHIAVFVNLSVDHLDYHKDIDEYQAAKFNLLKHQTADDYAILNKNSTFSGDRISELKSQIKYFAKDGEADAQVLGGNENLKVVLNKNDQTIEICSQEEIKLFGIHNLENIAAAALTADILKIDSELIKDVVKKFKGLPHRIELIAEIDGVKYINDSFATNPDPTMAAIDSFSENKILILGGSSKGADFDKLAEKIAKTRVKATVLIGDEADKIKFALEKSGFGGAIKFGGEKIDEIVSAAESLAEKGDVVILSPACASFGLFKNYKDRGEQFRGAVERLDKS